MIDDVNQGAICCDELRATMDEADRTAGIWNDIATERARQRDKWGEQNHPDGTGHDYYKSKAMVAKDSCDSASERGKVTWLHILKEEVYEAFAESEPAKLRDELVQVAAVALQWVESIDRRSK